MSTPKSSFDPKELTPAVVGMLAGLGILAFLVVLGLALGMTPSILFGVPQQ